MNKIPYTTPKNLQEDPKTFFSISQDRFVKVFTTAGSTGKPKKAYFTDKDIDSIINSISIGLKLLYNISFKDIVRLTFEVGYGTELWGNRYCLDKALGKIGALTIATGRLPVKEELEILNEYNPTVFMDVTSRINYITKELEKLTDLKKIGIKKILLGAEPTPNVIRRNIETKWNADVYVGYGITEIGLLMAGECEKKDGMHLSETNFFTEIVDPNTGEQLEDGEIGELIFTTYDREGMPLIRYRSHDLGRIIPGICKCGLPLKRIQIKGRTDDLIPIGAGDNIFGQMIDEAMFNIPEIVDYRVDFDKENGKDLITITAETEKINNSIRKRVLKSIMNIQIIKYGVISSKTITKPIVKLVKTNTLDRKSIKMKRYFDNRNLYD
jgi:phenylacetate-CoA ligase